MMPVVQSSAGPDDTKQTIFARHVSIEAQITPQSFQRIHVKYVSMVIKRIKSTSSQGLRMQTLDQNALNIRAYAVASFENIVISHCSLATLSFSLMPKTRVICYINLHTKVAAS